MSRSEKIELRISQRSELRRVAELRQKGGTDAIVSFFLAALTPSQKQHKAKHTAAYRSERFVGGFGHRASLCYRKCVDMEFALHGSSFGIHEVFEKYIEGLFGSKKIDRVQVAPQQSCERCDVGIQLCQLE